MALATVLAADVEVHPVADARKFELHLAGQDSGQFFRQVCHNSMCFSAAPDREVFCEHDTECSMRILIAMLFTFPAPES